MKKFKLQVKDTSKSIEMQVVMPLDLGIKIEAEDKVRTLIEVTERLDYSNLNRTYQRQPRKGEAAPKQMFQIVMLGFMLGVSTTRKLEDACKNDIRFKYLLGASRVPEHSKIARFVQKHLCGAVAELLFYQMVLLLKELNEIKFENLFVDGTKIEANANRYSFVWAKSTNKYEIRANAKLDELQHRLLLDYGIALDTAEEYRMELAHLARQKGIRFVHGRGKRKTQLQRDMEELDGLLARKAKYAGYQEAFRGRNSFSKTDSDATFMRMKDDHMRNGQLRPGYNLQIGVEGEYIVGAHVCAERSDELALLGLLKRMDEGLGDRHKAVVADAGYESEENYRRLCDRGQAAYIKPQNYEKSKTRKYRNNGYLRDNMLYDANTDSYTCPSGNTFQRIYDTTRKSKSGYEAAVTVYECSGCTQCSQKSLCTPSKGNRRMQVSKDFLALRTASLQRITTEHGKMLRMNRSIQVEGAFGVLKQDYGFRRFLRRGATNVFTEVLLYAMAYNLNKLHNKMRKNESGCTVYLLDSA